MTARARRKTLSQKVVDKARLGKAHLDRDRHRRGKSGIDQSLQGAQPDKILLRRDEKRVVLFGSALQAQRYRLGR